MEEYDMKILSLRVSDIFIAVMCILSFSYNLSYAESVIDEGSAMLYIEAVQDLPNNGSPIGWTALNYDTSQDDGKGDDGADWQTGTYGVGYADADDNTNIDNADGSVYSVYTRAEFTVADTSEAVSMSLQVDYDDGFIAWLNGVEVARSNSMSGVNPVWNATTSSDHEASQTNPPIYETFDISAFAGNLVNGRNILAVAVWNRSSNSSDLTLIPKLSLFYSDSDSPVLTRYPYIQKAGTDTVTVVWDTDIASNSQVEYGTTQAYGSMVSDPDSVTQHIIELTGLSSGTTYYYRVSSDGTVLTSSGTTFQTNKSNPSFTFTVFGDSGIASPFQSKVAQLLKDINPHFGLHTGDVIYMNGEEENYNPNYFIPYKNTIKRIAIYPTLGNHDVVTDDGQPYLDAFVLPENGSASYPERYYSFDYANAHFVCLDVSDQISSDAYEVGSEQYNWLVNDLASTTKTWKFVYFHVPPYSSNSTPFHGENTDVQDNLSPLFETYGVDMVFSGHSHHYERTKPIANGTTTASGVTYIVTGGGGAELAGLCSDDADGSNCLEDNNWWTAGMDSAYHLVKVSITKATVPLYSRGDYLRLRAVGTDGASFDAYTDVKNTFRHWIFWRPWWRNIPSIFKEYSSKVTVSQGGILGPICEYGYNISKDKYEFYLQPYVIRPNGKTVSFVKNPIHISLSPKGTFEHKYSLRIPASSETGTFQYGIKLTELNGELIDEKTFTFEVSKKGSINSYTAPTEDLGFILDIGEVHNGNNPWQAD